MKKAKKYLIFTGIFIIICGFILPLPSFTQTPADEDFLVAQKLYEDGVFDLAAVQFQNFIEKYPDDERCDEAQYWMGMSLWQTKKYEQAAKAFEELLKKYPKSDILDKTTYQLGECYYNLKMLDDALSAYKN
ncbi:tetratricopeptide repeat protein, partial [Candidatus Aerophobetes bacterium]|nr:tetratricopeptide repeat protein [Candidatus Aerophobetes bacterium]